MLKKSLYHIDNREVKNQNKLAKIEDLSKLILKSKT